MERQSARRRGLGGGAQPVGGLGAEEAGVQRHRRDVGQHAVQHPGQVVRAADRDPIFAGRIEAHQQGTRALGQLGQGVGVGDRRIRRADRAAYVPSRGARTMARRRPRPRRAARSPGPRACAASGSRAARPSASSRPTPATRRGRVPGSRRRAERCRLWRPWSPLHPMPQGSSRRAGHRPGSILGSTVKPRDQSVCCTTKPRRATTALLSGCAEGLQSLARAARPNLEHELRLNEPASMPFRSRVLGSVHRHSRRCLDLNFKGPRLP